MSPTSYRAAPPRKSIVTRWDWVGQTRLRELRLSQRSRANLFAGQASLIRRFGSLVRSRNSPSEFRKNGQVFVGVFCDGLRVAGLDGFGIDQFAADAERYGSGF